MFYDIFEEVCKKNNTTPLAVRKELGISQSTMASWKSRKLTPKYSTLKMIADYFNMNWTDLVPEEEQAQIVIDHITGKLKGGNTSEKPGAAAGALIRTARQHANMTQADLGAQIGVTGSMVAHYETGTRSPNLEQLKKISDVLGVSIEDLIDPGNPKSLLVPVDAGMIGTLDWFAMRRGRTVSQEVDIAIDYYLNDLATAGLLDDDESGPTDTLFDAENDYNLISLLSAFITLNDEGQQKAVERVEELTEIPKYQRQDLPPDSPTEGTEDK